MPDLPGWAYTAGWVFWLVWFAVLETLALLDADMGDTLTEHVRRVILHDDRPRPVVYFVFAGFLVWLVLHFLAKPGKF